MRRTLTYVWSLLCLCFVSTTAMAQNGQYDVRFAIKNFDCATNKMTIQVQVKAHDGAHTFLMGDANYRFDYDPRVIKNPAIVSQENFSNQAPSSDFNYNAQTLQGSSAGLTLGTVSLNTIYGGGGNAAKLVPTTWTTVSCIRFDVQDPTKCMSLTWHTDTQFPITGMNEVVLLGGGQYDLYVVNAGGVFTNYSECIPSVCNSILAQNDVNATLKNVPVSGNLLTNDISATAMTVTTTPLNAALHGVVTFAANGAYTYTPTANFVGQDSAQYKVCNASGLCDTAWLYLNIIDTPVGGVNSAPIAQNDNGTAPINTPITGNVLGNDLDAERNTLTVNPTPLTNPANGTLVLNPNGTFTYTPNNSFVGQDTFRYVVCDNGVPSLCDTAAVFLTVTVPKSGTVINLPPTPTDDSYLTYKNTTLTGDLKLNDSDPNAGQTLTYTTTPAVAPTHGTVTILANGTFTYVPTTGYTGPDYFVYTVCDNGSPVLCTNATANIVVTTEPNQKPVVTVTPQIIGEDTSKTFCLPIVDPNTLDTHTVTACTPSTVGGTATAVVDNVAHTLCVTYLSAPNYNGQDTVCFIVCDNGTPSKCDTVKVPITVTPINDKPVVTVTPKTITEDSVLTVCLPITDPDVGQTFTATPCGVGHGTATSSIVGNTVCITYTPTLNYNGLDTVCVIVCDNGVPSKCDTVKLPIVLTPVNDKPVITVVTPKTTVEDSTIIICTTITDPDGGTPTFTPTICGVNNGTATPSVIGNQLCITYTPTLNYNGLDTICVIVCDGGTPNKCDTTKIPIVVTAVNDKPVVTVTPLTIAEDSVVTFCMPFTDPDVGQTYASTLCGVGHGTATTTIVGNTVCVTYTPTLNYNGLDTVCVIVCDNGVPSKCDTVKVPITLTPVNDKPVITVVTPKTTVEDSTIIVCTTITDPDGGSPVFTPAICGVQHGTATPSVIGNQLCITYTPTLNYNGVDTICVIVCDNGVPSKCDTTKIPIVVTPVNDKPVVTITPVVVKEDTTITTCFPITDPDVGQTFSVTPCTTAHGTTTATIVGNTVCVTYIPAANYYGPDTACVIVCDNGVPSKCDTAKIPITVTPVNDKPIVVDGTATTPNTTPVTLCVPIVDADPTDTHTLSLCGAPTLGSISGVINNVTHQLCVTYTPTPGSVGTDRVCIRVCDSGTPTLCDTTDLTFIIGSTNDKPVATNDINNTLKNMPVSGNVKTNDSDPNFNTLTVNSTPVLSPVNGSIVLLPNGNYVYTPNPTFIGTETIKYQICDNGVPSLCDTATLTIEVRDVNIPGNQAPIAADDNTATPAGTTIVIAVKANDYDPQGGTIGNPTLFGTPVGGTPSVNPDGTVTFVPTPGFIGDASFKYFVCDNGTPSLCDSATVTVVVYPNPNQGNVAPVAIDDAYPVTLNTPFTGTVAANDYDQNAGQILSYTQVTNPTRGTVTLLSNGQVSFVPTTGFVGIDSFKYKVCDNGTPSLCDTAVVIFNITAPIVPPTNIAPVATDDVAATFTNTPVTINVKANDYDPNGGQTLTTPVIIGTPVGGTAVINPDGTMTFTPTTGFTGVATVVYQVCDNGTPILCDLATVTINVTAPPALANRPPSAGNDAATTPLNTPYNGTVATNDSDPDVGQTLSFTRITPPNNGVVTINATTGAFLYTPLSLFVGVDSFQYKVCDNGSPSLCDTAWAFITVAAPIGSPNVPPTANDDNATTASGTPIKINVKANDFDLNPGQTLGSPVIIGTPVGGTPSVNPDGTVTFTPTPGFTGPASFKYQVCDNGTPSLCDTATVTIDVTPASSFVNVAPVAIKDATTTPINTAVAGNAKTNDSDANAGQTLTYATAPVTSPLRGNIVLQTDGTYIYTPNAGFTGLDSAQYRVCDNGTPSLCATAWIVIEVTPAGVNNNMPPVVTKDNAATTTGMPVIINVKGNDYDPNTGQTLGLPTIIGTVPNGTATVNPDGTITFIPNAGFTGTTTFTYQVCDNGFASLCSSTTVTVVVSPTPTPGNINLAPVAVDDSYQTYKGTPVSGSVATNDTDPNAGQALSYGLLTNTANGIISLNANGGYTFTPNAGFTGVDRFTYKVCDNGVPSLCDTATVYFTIYDFPCVTMNLKVLLEGALYQSPTAGVMRTTLNERGLLPGQTPIGQFAVATPAGHPYAGAPWNLVDTTGQTMTSYSPNVTDWVLVSLRNDNTTAANVVRVPALLLKDGTVQFVNPCFSIANGNYYIVVEHRNHMGAMSPSPVPVTNGVINFDFTTGNSLLTTNVNNPPAFGQRLVGTKWALHAGDGLKNTQTTNFDINFNDSALWKGQSGIFDQYRSGDFDMNADVNFQDQVLWKGNNGKYSVVPH